MTDWITTDDVSNEAWRRILEFANLDFSIDRISKLHGISTNSSMKSNYKKQAQQIRVSLLQSQEYYNAAISSSTYTSPNHLYYSLMSMCTAIMLLKGSGEKSLDKLRNDNKNMNHGLKMTTGVDKKSCSDKLNILKHTYVKVQENGFFINWYSSLPIHWNVFSIFKIINKDTISVSRRASGFDTFMTFKQIINKKYSLINLLSRLPDFYRNLNRYGHTVAACRSNYEITIDNINKKKILKWSLHDSPNSEILESILNNFKSSLCDRLDSWSCTDFEKNTGCIVHYKHSSDNNPKMLQSPTIREDINGHQIMFGSILDTFEIVDIFIVAFALSMLARYYPDFWIKCIESHCMATKAIEQFVSISLKKYLILALNLLMNDDITISTHKPSW